MWRMLAETNTYRRHSPSMAINLMECGGFEPEVDRKIHDTEIDMGERNTSRYSRLTLTGDDNNGLELLGSGATFVTALIFSTVFNVFGYLIVYAFCRNMASHLGAVSGLALSCFICFMLVMHTLFFSYVLIGPIILSLAVFVISICCYLDYRKQWPELSPEQRRTAYPPCSIHDCC